MRFLWRSIRAWLLICGVILNVATAVAAWVWFDVGSGALRDRGAQALGSSVVRFRAIDSTFMEYLGRNRVASTGLGVPRHAEPAARSPLVHQPEDRRVLRVGPGQAYSTPGAAARAARDGDVIEIASGTDYRESVLWRASRLVIRGTGGLAHIDVTGVSLVQDKAAWVIQGDDVRVERIAFSGARSRDRNGAGIRAEGGHLVVNECAFVDNENGLLSNNVGGASVKIFHSTFARNGHANGQAHQIYIGAIGDFELRGNYLHATRFGSAVKSRAKRSIVVANRIVDGADGRSNYTLDFSDGGHVVIAGNELEQGPFSGNRYLIAFAAEASRWNHESLAVVHNTLVDDRGNGTFVWSRGDSKAQLLNNLFVGGRRVLSGNGVLAGNVFATSAWRARWGGTLKGGNRRSHDAGLADRWQLNYRPTAASPGIDAGRSPGPSIQANVVPLLEYVHPAEIAARRVLGQADAGAHEYTAR